MSLFLLYILYTTSSITTITTTTITITTTTIYIHTYIHTCMSLFLLLARKDLNCALIEEPVSEDGFNRCVSYRGDGFNLILSYMIGPPLRFDRGTFKG
jgi:hypothetical protein